MTQRGRILVVDDDKLNLKVLARFLQNQGYEVETADNGRLALEKMLAREYDLALLDVLMPEMDGFGVLMFMKQHETLRKLPVVVISALNDTESAIKCIELGAEDYLPRAYDPVLLKARLTNCLEKKRLRDQEQIHLRQIQEQNRYLEERVQEQVRQIISGHMATNFALAKLAESRDPETGKHLERVREYCLIIAEDLRGRPPYSALIDQAYLADLYAASPLHDIGKVGIPDGILLKATRLTDAEFQIMKRHTRIGADTLREVDRGFPGNSFIQMGIAIAETHHENWDGSGYPSGLVGEEIPLPGRITRLADSYDALRSRRSYKDAYPQVATKDYLLEEAGRIFDPDLIACFLRVEEDFNQVWLRYQGC